MGNLTDHRGTILVLGRLARKVVVLSMCACAHYLDPTTAVPRHGSKRRVGEIKLTSAGGTALNLRRFVPFG